MEYKSKGFSLFVAVLPGSCDSQHGSKLRTRKAVAEFIVEEMVLADILKIESHAQECGLDKTHRVS